MNGAIVTEFISYVFGGLIQNQFDQFSTSNDLIIIKTKRITEIKSVNDNIKESKLSIANFNESMEDAIFEKV